MRNVILEKIGDRGYILAVYDKETDRVTIGVSYKGQYSEDEFDSDVGDQLQAAIAAAKVTE